MANQIIQLRRHTESRRMPGLRVRLWILVGLFACIGVAQAQRNPLGQAFAVTHAANYDPSISPNGQQMVYISVHMAREQLFVMNVDGTHSIQITHDDAHHEDPAWSPDGKKFAFVYMKDGMEIISIMNTDGSGVEQLTPKTEKAIHPHWSPDGSKIAYAPTTISPHREKTSRIFASSTWPLAAYQP